jgi:hypothetical protein
LVLTGACSYRLLVVVLATEPQFSSGWISAVAVFLTNFLQSASLHSATRDQKDGHSTCERSAEGHPVVKTTGICCQAVVEGGLPEAKQRP